MTNMAFGVPCVRDFLAEHGHVLTVRGYDYKTETATVRDLGGVHIKRTKVCVICGPTPQRHMPTGKDVKQHGCKR